MLFKFEDALIEDLLKKAKLDPRGRVMMELTKPSENMQVLINVGVKNSEVPIHRHLKPAKNELIYILKGSVKILEYDSNGVLVDEVVLDENKAMKCTYIESGKWHALKFLSETAAIVELITGPYNEATHKEFASFTPSMN